MSRFCIVITSPTPDSEGAYSAFRFAETAIAMGHEIIGVFLYQAGVTLANSYQQFLSDERNTHRLWTDLANEHQIPLQVCVTAANRRGLLSDADEQQNEHPQVNLKAPFESVGIGELAILLSKCDRSIQF